LATGTLQAAQEPAHTGDVTNTAGSLVLTVANDAVTNAKLANVATATIKGRTTAGTGDPEDLTATQVKTLLAYTAADVTNVPAGAIAAITVQAALNELDTEKLALTGGTVTGDVTISRNGAALASVLHITGDAGQNRRLFFETGGASRWEIRGADNGAESGANTGSSFRILRSDDAGVVIDTPLVISRATGLWTITGAVTIAGALTMPDNTVTNAKSADIATARIRGRVTAGTGDPEDLTGTQATTILDTFTSGLKGLTPASGGGTTNFLRADGTWVAVSGTGDVVGPASAVDNAITRFDTTTGKLVQNSLVKIACCGCH
jgi:hypothetical protein